MDPCDIPGGCPRYNARELVEAVDKLANESAKRVIGPLSNPPLSVVHVRRKRTANAVRRGSIAMLGQAIQIRIITLEFLRAQRVYKYEYEVISEDSTYYGLVDIVFSTHILGAGHHYEVELNTGCAGIPIGLQIARANGYAAVKVPGACVLTCLSAEPIDRRGQNNCPFDPRTLGDQGGVAITGDRKM